jgi:hypothetical protein
MFSLLLLTPGTAGCRPRLDANLTGNAPSV